MNHTRQLAEQHRLSRRILMMGNSKEDNLYKVQVEISDRDRSEMSYYFIDGTAHISQVCDTALDIATEAFLGCPSQLIGKTRQQVDAIESAIVRTQGKEVTSEEISSEQKSSEETSSGQKSSSKKSRSKKEQVAESAPVQEEMELVESPYKDTKTEAAPKESVEKKKAEKTTAEPYNREDKASKGSFAVFATRLHNGSKEWKTREDLKDISMKLHGLPFMEKDGSIHPSFEEKCKELFGLDDAPAL